jgi:hypothetical protein
MCEMINALVAKNNAQKYFHRTGINMMKIILGYEENHQLLFLRFWMAFYG